MHKEVLNLIISTKLAGYWVWEYIKQIVSVSRIKFLSFLSINVTLSYYGIDYHSFNLINLIYRTIDRFFSMTSYNVEWKCVENIHKLSRMHWCKIKLNYDISSYWLIDGHLPKKFLKSTVYETASQVKRPCKCIGNKFCKKNAFAHYNNYF